MTPEQIKKELAEIHKKLDKPKKDFWDVFQIITGILVPFAIAYAAHVFSTSQQQLELDAQERQAEVQQKISNSQFEFQKEISTINAKVGQSSLISDYFDALLSKDPRKQQLAIDAVLIALPVEGPRLVKTIKDTETSSPLATYANKSFNNRRSQLVRSLFSASREQRIAAYNNLVAGWTQDPEVVSELLDLSSKEISNENGIYNAVVTLLAMDKEVILKYKTEINAFCATARNNGPKTLEQVIKLKAIMDESQNKASDIATNQTNEEFEPKEGWIFIGHFSNNKWGNTNAIAIDNIMPTEGETYSLIKDRRIMSDYPSFPLYREDYSGVDMNQSEKVEILRQVNLGSNKIWARVKTVP